MAGERKAKLIIDGKDPVEFPILTPVHGNDCIDIRTLAAKTGLFTYDSGFLSTASCQSTITYIDGDEQAGLGRKNIDVGDVLKEETARRK